MVPALYSVFSHPDEFPKPELTRRFLSVLLGEGVLVAEGLYRCFPFVSR